MEVQSSRLYWFVFGAVLAAFAASVLTLLVFLKSLGNGTPLYDSGQIVSFPSVDLEIFEENKSVENELNI